jgi:hypothetical protein
MDQQDRIECQINLVRRGDGPPGSNSNGSTKAKTQRLTSQGTILEGSAPSGAAFYVPNCSAHGLRTATAGARNHGDHRPPHT